MNHKKLAIDLFKANKVKTFRLAPNSKSPLKKSKGFKDGEIHDIDYFDGFNVGITTGNGFCIVDIDPRNGGMNSLAEIKKKHRFDNTVWVRTGGGGHHLYYEYPKDLDLPSFQDVWPGIDFLANDHYAVAPGSIHPDTRKEYVFDADSNPEEVPIEVIPDWLLDIILTKKKQRDETIKLQGTSEILVTDKNTFDEVRDALTCISPDIDYQNWVNIGMALKSFGDAGFNVFEEWSRGGKKFKEGECARKWNSFTRNFGVNHEMIFRLAYDHGWEPEPPELSAEDNAWMDQLVANGIKEQEEKKAAPPQPIELPKEEIKADPSFDLPKIPFPFFRGFVKEIYDNAPFKYPSFSIGSALACIAGVAQNKFLGPTGSAVALYQIAIGQTGAGKDYYTNQVFEYLLHIGEGDILAPSFASGGGMLRTFAEYGSRVAVDSEIGRTIKNKYSSGSKNPQREPLVQHTLQLWDSKGSYKILGEANKKKEDSVPDIENAAYSIFGMTQPEVYLKAVDDDDLFDSGLIPRFIVYEEPTINRPHKAPKSFYPKIHDKPYEALQLIYQIELPAGRGRILCKSENGLIDYVWDVIDEPNHKLMAQTVNSRERYSLNRVSANVVRIASLVAIFEAYASKSFVPVVTTEMINWAYYWLLGLSKPEAKEEVSESRMLEEKLIKIFEKNNGKATMSDLRHVKNRQFGGSSAKLKEWLKGLVDVGLLELHKEGKKYEYRNIGLD